MSQAPFKFCTGLRKIYIKTPELVYLTIVEKSLLMLENSPNDLLNKQNKIYNKLYRF